MKIFGDRVMVVAPHADDEVLGCGGLLAELNAAGVWTGVAVAAVDDKIVSQARGIEVHCDERRAELLKAKRVLGVNECSVLYYDKGQQLDTVPMSQIVGWLDTLLVKWEPTTVLVATPSFNKDHTLTYEAAMAALRPRPVTRRIQLVALYEYPYILSWHHEFMPNAGRLYVKIGADGAEKKLEALRCYESFRWDEVDEYHSTSEKSVRALMEERGREVGALTAEMYRVVYQVVVP